MQSHPLCRLGLLPLALRAAGPALVVALVSGLTCPKHARADCPIYITSYPSGRAPAFFRPPYPERAKDFAVVRVNGVYHVFYLRIDRSLPDASTAIDFGHAYSLDLLNWTQLPPVNPDGTCVNGVPSHPTWDAGHVWAPSIISIGSTYYMFYTGVTTSGNQAIGVSTSTDLTHWSPYSGNPVWTCAAIPWATCQGTVNLRDPFVMRDQVARDGSGTPGWLMYYTANPASGQTAVGVAWASYSNPYVWNNLGGPTSSLSMLYVGPKTESPHVIQHGSSWYLFIAGKTGTGANDPEYEGYVTSGDPVSTTWSAPVWLPTIVDTSVAGSHPKNWFASECVSDGTNDNLMFVHDYDPAGPCDPLCPGHVGPSTIESKRITWSSPGPGFTLGDLATSSDGSSWLERCVTVAPAPRWGSTMVYDSANDRTILFGGSSSASNGTNPVYYADVWSYSPSTHGWATLSPSGQGPAARTGHAAIYDAAHQRMLVVGGYGPNVTDNRVVYALSLSGTPTWSTLPPAPSAFNSVTAAYDADRDQMVTVDVTNGVLKLNLSTPAWATITSTAPDRPRDGTAVVDRAHHRLLFVGGWDEYTGSGTCPQNVSASRNVQSLDLVQTSPSWTILSAAPWPARYQASAFIDEVHNRLEVFGGVSLVQGCTCNPQVCGSASTDHEVAYNDAWAMNLGTLAWTQVSPLPGTPPPGRGHHASAYDPSRIELDVFGGGDYKWDASCVDCLANCTSILVTTYRGDTWTFRPDNTPPAAVTNLSGSLDCASGVLTLSWTAPGDDGTVGTAKSYDFRFYNHAITEANFYSAWPLSPPNPAVAGTPQTMTDTDLAACSRWWYALKTQDWAGNVSPLSNVFALNTASCWPCHFAPGQPGGLTLALMSPRPNPLRGPARFAFSIPNDREGQQYELSVLDVGGRRVRIVDRGVARAGMHDTAWDLRSSDGALVRGGVYFLRLRVGDWAQTQPIVALP